MGYLKKSLSTRVLKPSRSSFITVSQRHNQRVLKSYIRPKRKCKKPSAYFHIGTYSLRRASERLILAGIFLNLEHVLCAVLIIPAVVIYLKH